MTVGASIELLLASVGTAFSIILLAALVDYLVRRRRYREQYSIGRR